MTDVSVLGTGAMGAALAEGLAAAGSDVTVWNRTRERANVLSGQRVRLAASVGDALSASPLTIVSVSDHDASAGLIEGQEDLTDRVVASTSFADADRARAFADAVSEKGGHVLDLAIAAYPSEVRARSAFFLVSGDSEAYGEHRACLEQLGRIFYVGDTPGSAHLAEMAMMLGYFPMAVGLLQGIRVCRQIGLPLDQFAAAVGDLYPSHLQSLLEQAVSNPRPQGDNVEASIDVWGDAAADYAGALREFGVDAGMFDALHRLFASASDAGQGAADWTTIAQHVTNP
jgi:3-hydroxyisobutyrate dehydrogenase-like beta-hydroxyacid dehydrogenase